MSEIKGPQPDKTQYKQPLNIDKTNWGGWTWSILSPVANIVSAVTTPIINYAGYQTQTQKSKLIKERFKKGFEKAKIIGKGLNVPGTKAVHESYWQEILLKDHPPVERYRDLFETWEKVDTKLTFEDWIIQQGYVSSSGVKYLDENERLKYVTTIKKGILLKEGVPYDTTHEQTNFSGLGSAIFVIGPDNKIYTSSHFPGKFHHSSFLAGGATKGAGEIRTNSEGKLIGISSKSGHYKPTKNEMLNTLKILKDQGVSLAGVEVKLLTKEGVFTYSDAESFLDNPDIAPAGWEAYTFERDSSGNINQVVLNNFTVSVFDIPFHLKKLMKNLNLSEETLFKVNTSAGFLEYSIKDYLKGKTAIPDRWEDGELIKNEDGDVMEIRTSHDYNDVNFHAKLSTFLNMLQEKKANLEEINITFTDGTSMKASDFFHNYIKKFTDQSNNP